MRINKDKHIGRVLFIVEGSKTEFSILRKIFCNMLDYEYVEKRRNKPMYFTHKGDKFSKVAVVNTRESNIRDISENTDFLNETFEVLTEKYNFPVDQAAIYYLFDRDPESNRDKALIRRYIKALSNPYDVSDDGYEVGQLLLSYPSIEAYIISNFRRETYMQRFTLGKDTKKYIGENKEIQQNKIDEKTLLNATDEFLKYLRSENIELDIDNFSDASQRIFENQEKEWREKGYRLFSMLTLAFLQMGIIEI